MNNNRFKIEWGLSLISKYSSLIIEKELASYDITKTQSLFIIYLGQRSLIHQDQLANIFKMNRSTVTRAITYLCKIGLVTKVVDEHNKKANVLSLTDSGLICLSDINKAIEQWIDILTTGFTEEEIIRGQELIVKMAANACEHLGDEKLAALISRP